MSIHLDHGERWVALPFCDGYEVSSLGRVRSIDRVNIVQRTYPKSGLVTRQIRTKGKLLKPYMLKTGYLEVKLPTGKERVHVLVLWAFVGPRPEGMTASHLNGVRADNRLSNLVWESMLDNVRRQKDHGTKAMGERKGSARLNTAQVREIKGTRAIYLGWYRDTARKYGVHENTIRDIHQGRTWKHV